MKKNEVYKATKRNFFYVCALKYKRSKTLSTNYFGPRKDRYDSTYPFFKIY